MRAGEGVQHTGDRDELPINGAEPLGERVTGPCDGDVSTGAP